MAKAKNFTKEIGKIVAPSGDDIFNGIPTAGDDLLLTYYDETSDRTVAPTRPEPVQVISDVKEEEKLPEVIGEESNVNVEFVQQVDQLQRAHPEKSLDEIEQIVNAGKVSSQSGSFSNQQPGTFSDSPEGIGTAQPLNAEANRVGANEIVDWYDMGQQLLSVFGYEYFSSPKEAIAASEKLYPKISANTANEGERRYYEEAQKVLMAYTRRKTNFSETVAMSADLKDRASKLLQDILNLRGIQLSPEMLLGMLLLTPLVINGGRILLEKMGFSNADEMVGKFSAFVGSQESNYWQKSQP